MGFCAGEGQDEALVAVHAIYLVLALHLLAATTALRWPPPHALTHQWLGPRGAAAQWAGVLDGGQAPQRHVGLRHQREQLLGGGDRGGKLPGRVLPPEG